jgi:hypothetical protein
VVIHGIDYDGTGIYSGILDRSELSRRLPGTATAPALCGVLVASTQSASLHSRPRGFDEPVYTASLASSVLLPTDWTTCGLGEAGAALADTRRRAYTNAAA